MSIMSLVKAVKNIVPIFNFFLYFLSIGPPIQNLIKLPLPAPGPASFDFDVKGEGPYTVLADGRVVKYDGSKTGFVDFAYCSPNRTKAFCDGTNNTALGPTCGRPLSLSLYYPTGEFFIVDAYIGLCVVGPEGGLGTILETGADGLPFHLLDGIDVDQETGIVYITDASTVYNLSELELIISMGDASGRLLKYDPRTKQIEVLLEGLSGGAGVAISEDGSFLILTEFVAYRLRKYWLKGPKANTAEIFMNLTGSPGKIRRTLRGDFWVALTLRTQTSVTLQGQRISENGTILETLTFSPEFNSTLITEVHEHDHALFLGSVYVGYVGVYKY